MALIPGLGGGNVWSRLQGLLFGGAIGAAMSRSMEAVLEPVRQKAWKANQFRLLDPRTLAELAAKGFSPLAELDDEAARNGINTNRLQALYDLAQRYPGLGDLDKLSNRTLITPAQVRRVLARHGFGAEWVEPIVALFNDLLSVPELANAVQQGHVPNDGVLPEFDTTAPDPPGTREPVPPDQAPPSQVPLTQIPVDTTKEYEGQGYTKERFQVATNLAGLPPPQGELREMLNRGIIDEASFDAGIREGHTKTKWTQAVKRMRWSVIPAREYAEAWLRQWVTEDEAYAGGILTGYTREQMQLLYKNRGRTATPRQIWLAIARKVKAPDYPGEPSNGRLTDFHDHELAISRSNIRTEYAPLLYDIRFNYPPLFQLGRLVQAGAATPDQAVDWAEKNLTAPEVIAPLRVYWESIYPSQGGKAATTPSEVKSARTKLLTTAHKLYVVEQTASDAQVITALDGIGLARPVIDGVLETWGVERALLASAQPTPPGPIT